ncbi:F-box/LRR-repeat protein At1g55660-like [Miscanthus floridulus]|uniref:F-box/LRR-repeat protein At1g55660-like n=1 Tax=Miscanthus floridulus TaxID=154761 RepID=UPI003459916C
MQRKKIALAAAPPPPLVMDPAADRLSKLPEEVLAQILSFLQAQEAIRTCVLARTWRDVWKLTRRLRITGDSVREVRGFVDRLLRVRLDGLELASLEASEINLDPSEEFNSSTSMTSPTSTTRTRPASTDGSAACWKNVKSRCSGLTYVCSRINECCLAAVRKITSLSLKRLVITSCDSNEDQKRIRICVPRLVSLWLDHNSVRPDSPVGENARVGGGKGPD